MSTYWYFECQDHDPPIRSEDEFTQHTDDDAFRRAEYLHANRESLVIDTVGLNLSGDYFTNNAMRFLRQHPRCWVSAVSEYGERRGFA